MDFQRHTSIYNAWKNHLKKKKNEFNSDLYSSDRIMSYTPRVSKSWANFNFWGELSL